MRKRLQLLRFGVRRITLEQEIRTLDIAGILGAPLSQTGFSRAHTMRYNQRAV
jgi:hypothetical protein